jgi:hypothetical protein
MLFQRIKRADPEKIFMICHHDPNASASLVNGDLVTFPTSGTGVILGTSVKKSSGATDIPCGVAAGTIPTGDYGLIQVFGYHSSVKSASGTVGTGLIPSATTGNVANGAGAGDSPYLAIGYPLLAHSVDRTGVFIRLM